MRELSLHVLDVVENALEAGATRVEIEIVEDSRSDRLTIRLKDNGRGMDAETLARATDPFYTTRTTRAVGLGLPLLRAAAQRAGGDLQVTSQPGRGTCVQADFRLGHIDRAPLGDVRGTLWSILLSNRACSLRYTHRVDGRAFTFDTEEFRAELGDIPLTHPKVRAWLDDYLASGLAALADEPEEDEHA